MLIVVMMGKWSDDSACWVVHDVRLYSVLDTMMISGEDVCYRMVSSTLISIHFLTHSPSFFLITCLYHLSLPLLLTVVMR